MYDYDDRPSSRALVVDDEPLVRMFAADILEAAGFEVEEASNSDEALERLEQGDGVDAVVTDIEMPGCMDGCGLAWHVHGHCPDVAIVVVSGVMRPRAGELPEKAKFLPKPVAPEHLIEAVCRTLTERD